MGGSLPHQPDVQRPAVVQLQICGKRILALAVVNAVHVLFGTAAIPCVELRRRILHRQDGDILRQIAACPANEITGRQGLFRLHGEAELLCVNASVRAGASVDRHRFVQQLGKCPLHHLLHRQCIGLALKSVVVCPTKRHHDLQISHVSSPSGFSEICASSAGTCSCSSCTSGSSCVSACAETTCAGTG